jgi:hypothetical protein
MSQRQPFFYAVKELPSSEVERVSQSIVWLPAVAALAATKGVELSPPWKNSSKSVTGVYF